MTISASSWYFDHLRCPDCGGLLSLGESILCQSCEYASGNLRDLRPENPKKFFAQFDRIQLVQPTEWLKNINTTVPSDLFEGPQAHRDSRAFMVEIGKHNIKNGSALDLGCGPRDQVVPLEWLGLKYVGVDYSSEAADLLADAHSLPFADDSFDVVFSYAVLEHLHNPFMAMQEIHRVLKQGGVYLGTVSQGEPFHDSYFHHTAWGFVSLLNHTSGFKIERLWPSMDTISSLSRMGRYPRVIRAVLGTVDFLHRKLPFLAPRRMSWSQKDKEINALHQGGSIGFVCLKT